MAIKREDVKNVVEIYYQSPFKTFFVNSIDETTLIKPIGIFVSLGITTSVKVLEEIINHIKESGYDAILAEISSKKMSDRFVNTLINTVDPKQYKLDNFDSNIMTESQAKEELFSLREKMKNTNSTVDELKVIAPKVSKLQDLIDKLTASNGWGAHLIQKENDEYRIFHQYVNYKKDGDTEYRIGIFVNEN